MALQKFVDVGIHAFIVGIDDYTNLPGEDEPAGAPSTFGMKKLTAAAPGAQRFLDWLLAADASGSLVQRLASIEVLLAPRVGAQGISPQFVDNAAAASFVAKAWEWRNRVAADVNNIALFYFSGHGIQRSKEDAVLMMQDFAAPGPQLANAIGFFDLFSGMAASPKLPNMGNTQFYFVDACRNVPDEIKDFATLQTPPIFDKTLSGKDNRAAPVYFASYNDGTAFGSQFTDALLDALARGADSWTSMGGRMRWPVTALSLVTGITNAFAKLRTTQDFIAAGQVKDATICYLDSAPLVDLVITVSPEELRKFASLTMQQDGGAFTWNLNAPPSPPHPYEVSAPWGSHKLSVKLNGGSRNVQKEFGPLPITQRARMWPVTLS